MLICNKIIKISEVDSTNNFAIEQIKSGTVENGTIFQACNQTGGRGTGRNKWESEPGKNLTFSIVLYPRFLPPINQFQLSKCISTGIAFFLQKYVKKVSIKWPNDLYVGDRKIGGILIENAIRGNQFHYSIVGIGLNINQNSFSSIIPNPVSISQLTGNEYASETMLSELCKHLNASYQELQKKCMNTEFPDFTTLDQKYSALLYRKNGLFGYKIKEGLYTGLPRKITAKICGVDEFGRLKLITNTHTKLVFGFKEIEYEI